MIMPKSDLTKYLDSLTKDSFLKIDKKVLKVVNSKIDNYALIARIWLYVLIASVITFIAIALGAAGRMR